MRPRVTTTAKRVKRALVTTGRRTLADVQLELSNERGRVVYRDDVEFAPDATKTFSQKPLTPTQVDAIRRLRSTGLAPEEIASHLDVHPKGVRRVCAKYDMSRICEE